MSLFRGLARRMSVRARGARQLCRADFDEAISAWKHEEAAVQARVTLAKYGLPDEMTRDMVVWYNRAPWKRVVVQDMHILHNFPVPHHDYISHVVAYKVNVERTGECFKFDTSIIIEPTAGEIGARCHHQGANTLATNLLHDILQGKKSWREAQRLANEAETENAHPEYMSRLLFDPPAEEAARNPGLTYAELEGAQGTKPG
jgi:hypothetical protein